MNGLCASNNQQILRCPLRHPEQVCLEAVSSLMTVLEPGTILPSSFVPLSRVLEVHSVPRQRRLQGSPNLAKLCSFRLIPEAFSQRWWYPKPSLADKRIPRSEGSNQLPFWICYGFFLDRNSIILSKKQCHWSLQVGSKPVLAQLEGLTESGLIN